MSEPVISGNKQILAPETMRRGAAVLEKYCKKRYGNLIGGNSIGWSSKQQKCKHVTKYVYSTIGKYVLLLVSLTSYGLLGGALFWFIEKDHEKMALEKVAVETSERLNFYLDRMITQLPQGENYRSALGAILHEYTNLTGVYDLSKPGRYSWQDYWACVFYSGTLFTTIGYGNMACHSAYCRLATVIYSLIGIPIMMLVLAHWGQLMFNFAQEIWFAILRAIRASARRSRNAVRRLTQGEVVAYREKPGRRPEPPSSDLVNKIEDTVPLSIALGTVVVYTLSCAGLFTLWETSWDYSACLYFFYISLTTIGLGDEVPEHPKYALGGSMFFIIGLALVSMCVNVLHARMEARYMAALQLVEQQVLEERAQSHLHSVHPSSTHTPNPPANALSSLEPPSSIFKFPEVTVQYKSPSEIPERPPPSPDDLERRASEGGESGDDITPLSIPAHEVPPAVLGVLRARREMSRVSRCSTRSRLSTQGSVSEKHSPRIDIVEELASTTEPNTDDEKTKL